MYAVGSSNSSLDNAIGNGWTLSVVVYVTANISGAHINPAVWLSKLSLLKFWASSNSQTEESHYMSQHIQHARACSASNTAVLSSLPSALSLQDDAEEHHNVSKGMLL